MSLFSFTQPLAHVSSVGREPVEITRGDEKKVLFQSNGKFFLGPERCPHRGMKLRHATVTSKAKLRCPYHGIETASDPCSHQLQVAFDTIWNVQAGEKIPVEVPDNFVFCGAREVSLSAPFHVVLDNFNEGSHTPYIHRLLGPLPEEASKIQFRWKAENDKVDIAYEGPQRKSLLFHGLNRNRRIHWDIAWRTHFSPVHMVYHSKWYDVDSKKQVSAQNINYYYIFPDGDQRTIMYALVFTEVLPIYKVVLPIVKRISFALTLNQIREDEIFYPKIDDLPVSFDGLRLNRFDEPLPKIRELTERIYLSKSKKGLGQK